MKKIVIFLSILFSLISSKELQEYVPLTERMVAEEEINVLISPQIYEEIIAEVVNVVSKIYDELSKNRGESLFNVLSIISLRNNVKAIILNNMPTTFEILDINSEYVKDLALEIISIYPQKNINKNRVIDLLKARFIQFLSHYGFPEEEQPFITLDSTIKNGIEDVANKIIQNCIQIQLYQGYKSCMVNQFKYLYQLLPSIYSLIIQDSNLFNEITEISYQQTLDLNIVKNNIIEKITDFLDNIFSKDKEIANQMEPRFRLIKNQCLELSNRILIEGCVSPRIETIYDLIPFDLVETSDWIINEFMAKLVSSDNNLDMLIKIFLKLKIKSSNNNTLRLLTDNPENYGVTICRWFISIFSLSDEYCD